MGLFKKLYQYFIFVRPFAFVGIFFAFVLSSLVAISTGSNITYSWFLIIIGAFSCGLLASAAHTINNIYDLEIDKINKPFRGLPSKKINLRESWIITIIFYLFSLFLAFYIGWFFFILVLIMSFFTIVYSIPFLNLKKHWFTANLVISIPRGLLIIVAGWSVVRGVYNILPWYIGLMLFLFLWGAISTKDIADIKGDKLRGFSTLPVKYGLNKTVKIITPFFILPFLLIVFGFWVGIFNIYVLPLTFLIFYVFYIIWLIKKYPRRLTKIERNHIAWKHVYILYMLLQIGITVSFLIK